jgi:hypothetical protein
MFILPETAYEVRGTKKKGRGVFARAVIEGGTVIGDFIGTVAPPDIEDGLAEVVCYWRSPNDVIVPDMNQIGVHIINHSCVANCAFFPYKGHVLVIALRRIFPEEELSLFYAVEPPEWDTMDYFFRCSCGSELCRGTLYAPADYFERFLQFEKKMHGVYFRRRIAPYGEVVPRLKKYPKNVKDFPMYDLFGSEESPVKTFSDRKLPTVPELRRRIRESGCRLSFRNLGVVVLGMRGKLLLVEQ